MHLRRWEPLDELLCLRESIRHPLIGYPQRTFRRFQRPRQPAVEINEEEGDVVLFAALPKVNRQSLEVTVSSDIVTVKAATETPWGAGNGSYDHHLVYGFYAMPAPVLAGGAKASFKNGILEVRIPKATEPEARTVKVEVAI